MAFTINSVRVFRPVLQNVSVCKAGKSERVYGSMGRLGGRNYSSGFNNGFGRNKGSTSNSSKRFMLYPALGGILAATTGIVYMDDKEKLPLPPTPQSQYGAHKDTLKTYTYNEVTEHDSQDNGVWVTYKEGVYDVTKFVTHHPGGDIIMLAAGQSVDHYWASYPIHISNETLDLLESMRVGNLDMSTVPEDNEDGASQSSQWAHEPKRNQILKRNQERPFNAETPLPILTSQLNTPNDLFYVRNHLPVPERVDVNTFCVNVGREGSKSINLSLEDLKRYPEYTISSTIQCGGNRRAQMSAVKTVRGLSWAGGAIGNATWTGVRLCDVIKSLDLTEEDMKEVKHVQFEGLDEDSATGSTYGASIPIHTAMDPNSEVLLAYKMNGEELPIDHGYPLRVIVPGTVGARNVKWLSRVVLSEEESHSLWQRRDYKLFPPNITIDNVDFASSSAIQQMPVQSAICSPLSGSKIKLDNDQGLTFKGYAYSGGGRAINRVDVSLDGGKTWHTAAITPEPSQLPGRAWAWSLWELTVPVTMKGEIDVCCRAFDSSSNTQPENTESIWNFRGLCNNSWHRIKINIL